MEKEDYIAEKNTDYLVCRDSVIGVLIFYDNRLKGNTVAMI